MEGPKVNASTSTHRVGDRSWLSSGSHYLWGSDRLLSLNGGGWDVDGGDGSLLGGGGLGGDGLGRGGFEHVEDGHGAELIGRCANRIEESVSATGVLIDCEMESRSNGE